MRTITLELLRHGPAHNQLLSPLTPYLALCANHAAVTLNVPFEHNQFLHRLRGLGGLHGEESRALQLRDTAQLLGELLAQVPGLTAELNRAPENATDAVHLRLVLSASELALLPFELAQACNGFPGTGQALLLQSQRQICLTREVRRVHEELARWPRRPRILFAAASPPGFASVPTEAHLLALRREIDPWVRQIVGGEPSAPHVEDHLLFLPEASLEAIEALCAEQDITHVHLLAHGVEYRDGYDTRFGLALHDARDPLRHDAVSGERLAAALRASRRPSGEHLARPIVVTLAACESSNVGSVAGAGASVAHALHQSGIPVVIASQFPLSFAGSVLLVEELYHGMLWGADPRHVLNLLRRRLFAEQPDNHDWASLTAYVALPEEFERRLEDWRIDRTMKAVDTAMALADQWARSLISVKKKGLLDWLQRSGGRFRLHQALSRMQEARTRLTALGQSGVKGHASRINGLLASAYKRDAEIRYLSRRSEADDSWVEPLRQSWMHYWDGFMTGPSNAWAIVQYLSLEHVLRGLGRVERTPHEGMHTHADLWSLAHVLSTRESTRGGTELWGIANLIELHVLAPLLDLVRPSPEADPAAAAVAYARRLVAESPAGNFQVFSTRRQMLRYQKWWGLEVKAFAPAVVIAAAVLDVLPELPEGEGGWAEDPVY